MSEPVYVIATIKTIPGKETAAELVFKGVLEATHREDGCLMYALHKRLDQPGTYYFVEQWKSKADMDQHLGSAHLPAALSRQKELFSLLDIGVVAPLPFGDPQKGLLFQN